MAKKPKPTSDAARKAWSRLMKEMEAERAERAKDAALVYGPPPPTVLQLLIQHEIDERAAAERGEETLQSKEVWDEQRGETKTQEWYGVSHFPTPEEESRTAEREQQADAAAFLAEAAALNNTCAGDELVHFPATSEASVTLSQEHPRAVLLVSAPRLEWYAELDGPSSEHRGHRRYLTVAGLGTAVSSARRKRPPVELTAFGRKGRRQRVSVPCDGLMLLDGQTIRVRVELMKPQEGPVTITLSVKGSALIDPIPKGWTERRERPPARWKIEGRGASS